MQSTDVVVGAGIAGLLAALLLAERDHRKVLVVEREPEPGGLLRRFHYPEAGSFDYGMHNMYETGVAALDDLLFGLLPEQAWQILDGPRRDLAGLYFQGGLQHHSPYPDLRRLAPGQRDACMLDFFRQLDGDASNERVNAYDEASARFGRTIADSVTDVVLRRQFGRPASEMATFATRLTTLNRMVMFGERSFPDLMLSSQLRDRLAYPEQRTLPSEWASGRKAYYPKAYGIHRVPAAMLARLRAAGVELMTSASVKSLEATQGRIQAVHIGHPGGQRDVIDVGRLVWTAGLPVIANLLGLGLPGQGFDAPRKTVIVNLLLRDRPAMGDLYYFYCFDPGFHTFRVTNFEAYCEGAPRPAGYPVSVELLMDDPLPGAEALKAMAVDELVRFGVIESAADIVFGAAEVLSAGFPMPTSRNFSALTGMRERIKEAGIGNLLLLGILSEDNIFFQRDVLAQTHAKLTREGNADA